jgi:hypothetical protein
MPRQKQITIRKQTPAINIARFHVSIMFININQSFEGVILCIAPKIHISNKSYYYFYITHFGLWTLSLWHFSNFGHRTTTV